MALSQPFRIRCRQVQISSTEVGRLTPRTDTTCQCGKENQTINHLLACEKTGNTSSTEVGLLTPRTDTTCQCGKENQTINHLLACEKTGNTSSTEVGLLTPRHRYHLPVWKRKSNHQPFVNLRKNWNNLHHG